MVSSFFSNIVVLISEDRGAWIAGRWEKVILSPSEGRRVDEDLHLPLKIHVL